MKIAILGNGFIGGYISAYLTSCNSINKVSLLTQASHSYHKIGFLSDYIKKHEIDVVVNTCGYTGHPNVDACENDKEACLTYNVIIPILIEKECKLAGAKFIHISSGCIYTGYNKDYTEDDEPNFGWSDKDSSYYSKTKHLSEILLDTSFTNIVRIRMPITNEFDHKNLLTKLYNYNNIIDYRNSKTDVLKLSQLVEVICLNFKPGIYNAVHSNALSTSQVIDYMKYYGIKNNNWKFVPYDDLPIKANRSNCVLDNSKIKKVFNFDFGHESLYIKMNCSLMQRRMQKWPEKV